jgi:hypothetical protein
MIIRLLAAIAAIPLCSCVNVVRVKHMKPSATTATSESGIPFYVKAERFRQVTVYRESWYLLTLKVDKKLVELKDGKEVLLDRGSLSFSAEAKDLSDKDIVDIKSWIVRSNNSDVNDALAVIAKFQGLSPRNGGFNQVDLKNEIESEWVVDSARTYYLNAPLPWFGTGSLTQKINADGTLAEATATADTKLAEGLGAILPLKEFLTGEFIDPAPAANADPSKSADVQKGLRAFISQGGTPNLTTKQYVYVLSLSTEETGFEVTLKSAPVGARPTLGAALTTTSPGASLVRKPLPVKVEPPADDTPTIGISGNIKLPKPK